MRPALPLLLLATFVLPAQADWKSDLKGAAKQQASAQVEQKLGLANPAPAGAQVYFINLVDGATVTSPVLIQFGLKKAGVAPAGTQVVDTGHHHLLIDDPQVDLTVPLPASESVKHFGGGQTETLLSLKPGKHTLQMVFGDWKHQPFNPTVSSAKITVTVK